MVLRCLLVALALATACSRGRAKKDACDGALELIVADLDRRLAAAGSDDEKRALESVTAGTQKHFVDQCRTLDDEGKACVARMQEFLEIGRKAQAELEGCVQRSDGEVDACLAEMDKHHHDAMGACTATMERLAAAVSARGQADWEAQHAEN